MAMKWLEDVRTRRTYTFMGGAKREFIKSSLEHHMECPVCFEDDKKMYFILPCGHHMCSDCTYQIAHVEGVVGLWYNKLAWSKTRDCPICKFPNALSKTEDIIVYRP